MSDNNKLHAAINCGWINKYDKENPPTYTTIYGKNFVYNSARGWRNNDFHLDDFVEAVCIEGHAFLPQIVNSKGVADTPDEYNNDDDFYFNGPYRAGKNFHQTNVVAVDIDERYDSVDQLVDHPFFKQYGVLIYSTPSHNPDEGLIKCRLVFRTEYDIDNGKDLTFIYTGLIATFGGDKSCTDPCRMFYGSKNSYYETFPDNFLPWSKVKELVKIGKKIVRSNLGYSKQTDSERKASQSNPFIGTRKTIDQDMAIILSNGNVIEFRKIPTLFGQCGAKNNDTHKFRCYCPLHDDANPSAFISTTKSNIPYLYCSKCSPATNGGKAFFMTYSRNTDLDKSGINTIYYDERYLPKLPNFDSVLLVKSPKGTGKTEQLISVVEQCKIEKKRVLLIGHRISLLQSMSDRLGLDFYLDNRIKHDSHISGTPHMAICFNSLLKMRYFKKHPYDVIIMDESEQLINHIVGETIIDNEREDLMNKFSDLLTQAGKVICLDADLSDITIETICERMMEVQPEEVTAIINAWKPKARTIDVLDKLKDIEQLLFEVVNNGRTTIAVLSNSKKKILNYLNTLLELHPSLRVLVITSDNSQDEQIQKYLKDINKTLDNYDVFLASPSIGTGVDITKSVDHIFGIFEHSSGNTASDIDQHLHRFRNPNKVSVWINPAYGTEETNKNVILHKMLFSNNQTNELLAYAEPSRSRAELNYINTKVLVEARANQSRNYLRNTWLAYQHDNNVTINHIEPQLDDSLSSDAKVHKDCVKRNKEQYILDLFSLVNNEYIEDELYHDAVRKKRKGYDDKLVIDVYDIQQFFYGYRNISIEIVTNYKNLMRDVLLFEEANTSELNLKEQDELERLDYHLTSDRNNKLAGVILKLYILTKFCRFESIHDTKTYITNKTLQAFVQLLDTDKTNTEAILGVRFQNNYADKPVQAVSVVFRSVGLKLTSKQVTSDDGERIRQYRIDEAYYSVIHEICSNRSSGFDDKTNVSVNG